MWAQSLLSAPPKAPDKTQNEPQSQKPKLRILNELGQTQPKESAPEVVLPKPVAVESQPLTEDSLGQVEALAQRGETSLALTQLQALAPEPQEGTGTELRFRLMERRYALEIDLAYRLGQNEVVVAQAQAFVAKWSGGPHFHLVYYQFAQSLKNLNRPLESTSLVDEDFFNHLSQSQGLALRGLLIEDALAQGKTNEAFSYLEVKEKELFDQLDRWTGPIIDRLDNQEELDELIGRNEQNLDLAARLKLRKIHLWVRSGEYDKAQAYLADLLKQGRLSPELYGEFVAAGSFVEEAKLTKPYKIGVILPFSHKNFGPLAEQVLEGLQIGLAQYATADRPLELVLKDSSLGSDNRNQTQQQRREQIGALVRELVLEDHVVAILGPLAKESSIAAGEAAERYKVPVISYSLTENIGEGLPYLFRFQRNNIEEAKAIANYATDYLQARRFVILYNPDKNGFLQMEAFTQEILKANGIIVGVRPIGQRQVDFQEDFLSFTGGFEPVSDADKAEMEKTRDRLDPKVDFDAIYAPVQPYTMNILTQFANLFEADRVYFLAGHDLNRNENQLIDGAERMRFVDSYPISGVNTYLLPFFEEHWRMYNHRPRYRPPTAYGIYGYQSLQILAKLLNEPKNHRREVLRDTLASLKGFEVLTGRVTTTTNRELYQAPKVLKIKANNTVEAF
ncbi:MAG: hypothetical protein A2600_07295 [Candidatus Lambdaproteobacteria bacterium RIFOXYD1_FULL_56_27]|uniref:Leucine-binding protein domain-containing protein n=1 Tax=Candidatus Lambdaproteobacteria bacterium RIFOXYD2_FULL_56_26 TaxID=1817773 RepID=A0A1F6GQ91_9PROT|nr:MAG: hypothetical protein A2557_05955 [Candidatus Lambdaproteobacteria bacterium RIFOXYD2_FULL_56_26]OGH03736.1 MAG: hypothetical protein A2426_00745 [Candidatus Lambdaproteobacteria bacterium RIFOXYC1_FULL_56_13]OGH07320.1 MAG: hypothetical protein A2600_07295 [Candidatus Lambdaproteobacteria bacterium RIFOXYD1_FULL_56_27]